MGRSEVVLAFVVVMRASIQVLCYEYKVGDLDSWGIPTSSNPQLYAKWSQHHTLNIGDSLLFLYPPTQDSVLQVSAESYSTCNLKDPMWHMNNGNSVFNITSEGDLFFVSGQTAHCEKQQKLHILVGNVTATASSPTQSASYPTVFGTIPAPPSSSSPSFYFQPFFFAGLLICTIVHF